MFTSDKNFVYEKILAIHDEAIASLASMHIPPYPFQYKKQFDKIFHSVTDSTLRDALKENVSMDDKLESIKKYMELTKAALSAFSESHMNISNVAEKQNELLASFDPYESAIKNESCIRMANGLTQLGDDMAVELKRSQAQIVQLHQQLEEALRDVTTDPLTHLYNHRKYMDDLNEILTDGMDCNLPLLSIMINADKFQTINHTYGHIAGDKVLYFLAQTIKSMAGKGEHVYRYGGDQIAILITPFDEAQAFSIAEKIRTKVEHSHLIYSGKSIELTISIGATMHCIGDDLDSIIERTENNLLISKSNGGNQTHFE